MTTEQSTPDSNATTALNEGDTPPSPAKASERIASLDWIRGIAVLGILAANIVFFGQPQMAYMWPDAFVTDAGDPNNWMWLTQFVLIDGKMRGLFTVLFGVGLVLFMDKAWSRGAGRMLLAKRLFWLLLFGLFHFYFIWRGDILSLYAISGVVAMAFIRWSARKLLVMGLLAYLIGGLLYVTLNAVPFVITDTSIGDSPKFAEVITDIGTEKDKLLADGAAETEIMTSGNYVDFVQHSFDEHLTDPFTNAIMFLLFETLPLMLVGMGLYRAGLFDGRLNPKKQALWGWVGVVSGSALTLWIGLSMIDGGPTFWGSIAAFTSFSHYPRLPVVLGLTALLALWGAHASGWLAERLSAAGRAAFTNYLGTSVLMMLIFHPWAGGYWGELSRPELYFVVLVAWAVMLAWSKPWLDRFRYGPLEWLWRCLTYGRMFPLKR